MQWKRSIGWTLAGFVIVLLVAGLGGYFYLQSTSFQQFALREITKQTYAATGGKTEAGALDFSLSTLTAHLYNITVRGTESAGQPALLHVDKLTVRLKIISALRRQVALRELLIERPVVHLQVTPGGTNNLPSAPPSQNGSHTDVFDLAVGHAQLTNGEIDYNDRKIPLDFDVYDLGTDIHFSSFARSYDGELSYTNGRLGYAQYPLLPHSLSLKFSASPERFGLESATLTLGSSEARLHAVLSNYSSPVADADYQLRIHAQDFASMSPSVGPAGDVALAGTLHYQRAANEPPLRSVTMNGRVASEAVSAAAPGKRMELRKLQGTYQLAGGSLRIDNVSAEALGGRVIADAVINNADTTPDSRVQVSLHDLSLRALQQVLGQQEFKGTALSGRLNGTADAAWRGSMNDLHAKSDLTVQALASSKSNPSGSEVPLDGAIHATYDGTHQSIGFRDTSLRIPAATITAEGEISNHSSLQLQLSASDLHQLTALAASFRAGAWTPPAVSGSAALSAVVQGSMKRPTITGQLSARNLQVEGSEWSSAKLDWHADASGLSVRNGSLVNAHRGQATFSASVALRNWAYQPSGAIRASLNAQQLRLTDLLQLANQHYPLSGELSAKLTVEGSQLNPQGSGSAQIANARAYGEPIQNLGMQFRAADGSITSTLNVAAPAGALNANLSYTPKTRAYKVRLDAPSLVLEKLQTVQAKNLPVTGTVNASVNGEGTLDDPQLAALVQLPRLQVRQNEITGLKAEVHIAQHSADLDVNTQVSQASVHAHGHVALSGDYLAEAAIDTGSVPLDLLMASYAGGVPQGFAGQTEFHATLKGPLKEYSQMEAHLSIPVLKASYQSLEIGITNPIRADYANSVITLQPAEIRGTDTVLHIQGKVPVGGNAVPTLTAQGSLDARILRILAPDLQSSGTVALDVHASGSAAHPAIRGQVQLTDIALSTSSAPVGVEKLNGKLSLSEDRLQVSELTGQVGGGQVSMGGAITYRPSVQFNLALQGKSVRLRYPEGVRSLLDANLTLGGTMQGSTLNGRVLIDSLSFTPDFDLSKFGDQFASGTTTLSQPGFAERVKLAIGVQSRETLNATSSQVSIAGSAALQVGGTAADPVITGRTNLTSGELFYRNVRYQLQRGGITFDDPNQTHPVMNVTVTTTVEQYNLTLSLRGPLDKLTTSYTSDPPLATADVISLVARGQTTQEAAASSQSTDSMIASQALSQVSSGVQKLAGISSLQIDPLIGGNNQNPSAVVALQQRVTKNLLFTFSTDVSQPGTEIVQGEYQINKRWSVSTTRDQLGGVSVDGRFHTRF